MFDELEQNFNIINIRVVSRNARKCITFVNGIPKEENIKDVLKNFKKNFSCNGSISNDDNYESIKMSGDQSENILNYFKNKYPTMRINIYK